MKKTEFQISIQIKLICLIFLFLFSFQALFSQRNIKYKDVYKVITERSKEEAYSLLLVFQKQEPFNANTYLQLGLLAQYWSKEYDALTNLKDVEYFIYNTNLYFGLAYSKVDQKEIRKNDKFYQNIERFKNVESIDFEAVKLFIQEQIDANNEYKKNVKIVTNYFNLSILHYNNCINIFKEINTSNNKIKDIYLTADNELLEKLNKLENSFDSTIYYLQNYQTAIKNYPIKNYNQKYKLLPIETYRLHGLTSSDFLQDEIPIWDYRTWVKNVKQILDSDIKDMRVLITKADDQLNQDINMVLNSRDFKPDFNVQKVDEKLKFKIGKFDHKSLLLELFKYKESKLDFLVLNRDPLNNPKDSLSGFTFQQKSRFYASLIDKKNYCDSLNNSFSNRINSYDLNKYKDFFTNIYGGEAGLNNYCKFEKLFTNQTLNNSLNQYKEFFITSSKQKNTPDSIVYKNSKIQLNKSNINIDKAEIGKYYTSNIQKNNAGDFYITGYIKQDNSKSSAFVAKTNKLESIRWLQIIAPEKQEKFFASSIFSKEDGCEVIFNLIDTPFVHNQIIGFDSEGKPKEKIEVGIAGYPRYFSYDEINQKYLMVFKGLNTDPMDCLSDELIICQYDGLSKQEEWVDTLKLNGTFVDIVKMNQNIFMFTNFTNYQTPAKNITSEAGNSPEATNSLLIVLDENGKIKNETPILYREAFHIDKTIKIGSNAINLIGFKNPLSKIQQLNENEQGNFLYLLLNSNGEVYFDNWK